MIAVRDRCLEELQRAYEDAGFSGLCGEGRWEYALDRLRQMPPERLIPPGFSPEIEAPEPR